MCITICQLNKGMMKMKKPVINKSGISPACGVCAHGIISADNECVLCIRTGIRAMESSCNKFKYDPLKRVPRRRMPNERFTEEDFKL